MTKIEFKAWFEGFTEALTGTPTKEQWKRIKARVAEIDGQSVTERVFVDRYWPPYQHYPYYPYHHYPYYPYHSCSGVTGFSGVVGLNTIQSTTQSPTINQQQFSSLGAMNLLGQAEATSLTI